MFKDIRKLGQQSSVHENTNVVSRVFKLNINLKTTFWWQLPHFKRQKMEYLICVNQTNSADVSLNYWWRNLFFKCIEMSDSSVWLSSDIIVTFEDDRHFVSYIKCLTNLWKEYGPYVHHSLCSLEAHKRDKML